MDRLQLSRSPLRPERASSQACEACGCTSHKAAGCLSPKNEAISPGTKMDCDVKPLGC